MMQKAYALSGPPLVAVLLLAIVHVRASGPAARLTAWRVGLRDASPTDFAAMDGAGRGLVERIRLVKAFADLDVPARLRWVPGIGSRRLHRWWPWLAGDGPRADEDVAWRR